LVEE
jgi:hypothetical protein